MPTFCFLEQRDSLVKMACYCFLSTSQSNFISTDSFPDVIINLIKITAVIKIAQYCSFYYWFHSFKFTLSIKLTTLIFIFTQQTELFMIYFIFEVAMIIKVLTTAAWAHKAIFPAITSGSHFMKSKYFHPMN